MPWSKSKTDRLGERLRKSEVPSDEDLAAYEEMVQERYGEKIQVVITSLEGAGFSLTTRFPKTAGTLIEKLKRDRTRLSTVQDVAGARIVCEGGRPAQDEAVERILGALEGIADCTIRDRRDEPSFGYRAVHVIAEIDGILIEIQVRTDLQDQWANLMEKFADIFGRQVRYGSPPDDPDAPIHPAVSGLTPRSLYEGLLDRADHTDRIEFLEAEVSEVTLDLEEVGETDLEWVGIDNWDRLDDETKRAVVLQRVEEELETAKQDLTGWMESFSTLLSAMEGLQESG